MPLHAYNPTAVFNTSRPSAATGRAAACAAGAATARPRHPARAQGGTAAGADLFCTTNLRAAVGPLQPANHTWNQCNRCRIAEEGGGPLRLARPARRRWVGSALSHAPDAQQSCAIFPKLLAFAAYMAGGIAGVLACSPAACLSAPADLIECCRRTRGMSSRNGRHAHAPPKVARQNRRRLCR